MQIGFIGTGRITRRLVGGAAGQGHEIFVTKRSPSVSAELASMYPEVRVVDSAQEIADLCEALFLCLPADTARAILPGIRFRADQSVVSVMVGFTYDELQTMTAPAGDLSITIPMPSIEHGGCPLPAYPHTETLESIYGSRNTILPLDDEAALRQFFVITGTVMSVLEEFRTFKHWLAGMTGDPATAERYITGLYGGYLTKLEQDGTNALDAAIHDLSIEGGLNATLRERLKASGHYDDLHAGLDALMGRLKG